MLDRMPNSSDMSNFPAWPARRITWAMFSMRSKRWSPVSDLTTRSRFFSSWSWRAFSGRGSMRFLPASTSSRALSRKRRSQVPGTPAETPLIMTGPRYRSQRSMRDCSEDVSARRTAFACGDGAPMGAAGAVPWEAQFR